MKANDWISVKDRLPQIDKRVMVCQSFNDGRTFAQVATRVKINKIDMWYNDGGFDIYDVTHWQPIVLPKKEKQ